MKSIVVTSPATDVGKTVLASSISEAAAMRGYRTLLVDTDNHPGELLTIFGCERSGAHPILDCQAAVDWESCARSPQGTYLLPGKGTCHGFDLDRFAASVLSKDMHFDFVVIDMDVHTADSWRKQLLVNADLAILVTDCSSKAMYRVKEFLNSYYARPQNKWTLCVNNREGKSRYYSPVQMARTLGSHEDIRSVMEIPFESKLARRFPPLLDLRADLTNSILDTPGDNSKKYGKPEYENRTVVTGECSDHSDNKNTNIKNRIGRLLSERRPHGNKQGIIMKGAYLKERFSDPVEMLDKYSGQELDAIIVSASLNFEAIRQYRRDPRSRNVLLIVLKGERQHIAVGADRVVPRLNSELIDNVASYAARLRELWARVELDYLTQCYKREFFEAWLIRHEEQERLFSIVFIDPDRFKMINDSYGHEAGDSVLVQFSSFLRDNSRSCDLVFRWGGDEFIVAMPDTSAREAYALIDRLREKWAARRLYLPGGAIISSTFSAGVAEYFPGCDVVQMADKMMYQAKQNGRNQVHAEFCKRIGILGTISEEAVTRRGFSLIPEIQDADCVICDSDCCTGIPADRMIYVIGKGGIHDWSIRRNYPHVRIFPDIDSILDDLENNQAVPGENQTLIVPADANHKLAILPGTRSSGLNQTIPFHGALFVVCPSRPGLAGETAAYLALSINKAALVCASSESTAAIELGIPDERLITTDWRLPRADAPMEWGGLKVWPVDPHKYLNSGSNQDVYNLIEQIKSWFSLIIVDCGGSLSLCSRVARNEGILVLHKEGDAADAATNNWLKKYGGEKFLIMTPSEKPSITEADNGFIISGINNSAKDRGCLK